ncbi:tyrosine-type recombinase/integrase [Butyricicoccus sp. AM27-36]|jgi:integrase/recombinase XerD|uniref:tyrosine-type recombinase/integrase n=1 Tax=Butyricicoccus sp. AM27-36 TaxID=2292293 RepID=UPI000E4B5B67|nr:tyrosine-type recombinase/integrase [Butyricicoccus sp. AM27-36]RHT85802.1 integrase [Butyricicoccus sp. AM27-36]
MNYTITRADIDSYCLSLAAEERASGTIEKYRRDIVSFTLFLDGRSVTKEIARDWKAYLQDRGYAPRTINTMLSALNSFFRFAGWDIKLKFLKIQHQLFRDPARELSRAEYDRLIVTARESGQKRLALIMETLCATGIRISELRYITVEAAKKGRTTIALKGKIRTILLPTKLCRKLVKYAKKQKIASGEVFLTKSGKSITRRQVWYELKRLCHSAGVEPSKVFPHNFRHLFATTFYHACKDIARLADVLGHSSIETTRIYLTVSGAEQARQLDELGLIS